MMASVYRGHNDTFLFNDNAETAFLSEKRLRFAALSFAPHVMVHEVARKGSQHWFNVAGPLYSVLKEAALKGNLSLYYYDLKGSVDQVKQAVMSGKVDIFAIPTHARMEAANQVRNLGVGFPIGHSMDVINLDHVLYRIGHEAKKHFVFSNVLDIYSWITFLVLLFLVALVNHLLARKHSVWKNLWYCAMSCLQPVASFHKNRDRILAAFWCLMVFVLMNYYGSQFFSNITVKKQPIVIDSLEDLAKTPKVKVLVPAATFEFKGNQREMEAELAKKYFVPEAPYYEALRPRLTFYRQDQIFNNDFRDELIRNVTSGTTAWLYSRCTLNDLIYHYENGKYRDKVYVSRSGGDWQPMFLSMLSIAEFHRELIETVIIQLSESGIYHLWKQDIVEKVDNSMLAEVKSEAEALEVDILWGPFIYMAIIFSFSFLFYFIEIKKCKKVAFKRKKQRAKTA